MSGVSIFDWSVVFGIPFLMCMVFLFVVIIWATNGEEK